MTSSRGWIWVACAIVGAVVIALAVSLVAVARPANEPLALGTPIVVDVGANPQAVAPTPDGRRVLVLSQTGLTLLDAGTSSVIGTISLRAWYGSLLIPPDGERAYLASPLGVDPVDLTTGLIQDTVGGEGGLSSVEAVSPDGARLVGVIQGPPPAIGVVDLAAGTTRRIPLPSPPTPEAVVVAPDGNRLYAAPGPSSGVTDPLQVIDVVTGAATPVPGTEGTLSVALSSDGRSVHAIGFSKAVVLDAATGTVARSVSTGLLSGQFVASPDGRYLYVVDVLEDGIRVVDMDSGTVVATLPLGTQPRALALAPDGSRLYVVTESGLSVVPVTGGR